MKPQKHTMKNELKDAVFSAPSDTYEQCLAKLTAENELEKHRFILKNQKFLLTIMSIDQFKATILESEKALGMPDGYTYAEKIITFSPKP